MAMAALINFNKEVRIIVFPKQDIFLKKEETKHKAGLGILFSRGI